MVILSKTDLCLFLCHASEGQSRWAEECAAAAAAAQADGAVQASSTRQHAVGGIQEALQNIYLVQASPLPW